MSTATFPPDDLESLSVEERLRLIERVWDSLAGTPDRVPIPDWQLAEIERRLASMERNPDAGSKWVDVARRIRDGA